MAPLLLEVRQEFTDEGARNQVRQEVFFEMADKLLSALLKDKKDYRVRVWRYNGSSPLDDHGDVYTEQMAAIIEDVA